jgi:hypothetical protein
VNSTKNLIIGLGFNLLLVHLAMAADVPPVNDGNGHADPPFLRESGWTYRTPERQGWVATRAMVRGGMSKPEVRAAVPIPGDRIVNSAATLKTASDIPTAEKSGDLELYIEFTNSKRHR